MCKNTLNIWKFERYEGGGIEGHKWQGNALRNLWTSSKWIVNVKCVWFWDLIVVLNDDSLQLPKRCETARRQRALAIRTCARGTVNHWKHRGGLCAWHLAESCKRRNRERSVQSACDRGLRRSWLVLRITSCSVCWYSPVQDSELHLPPSLPSNCTARHCRASSPLALCCPTCTTFVCEESVSFLCFYCSTFFVSAIRTGCRFGWKKTHENSSVRGARVSRAGGA